MTSPDLHHTGQRIPLMTTHDDAEGGLKASCRTPQHVAVGKELIKPVTESRQAIDYTFKLHRREGKGLPGNACGSFLPPPLQVFIRPQPATPPFLQHTVYDPT